MNMSEHSTDYPDKILLVKGRDGQVWSRFSARIVKKK
jgi:hypothetical protein